MKYIKLTLCSLVFASNIYAQNSPINFETGGHGAAWTWTVFENNTNPPLEIIANPNPSGINVSNTVAKFTALDSGANWAGCESKQGVDLGTYTLSSANKIVTIMVWKSFISDVGIKLVTTSLGALPELKKPNTLINQWEKLTFDFTGYINNAIYSVEAVNQIVVFPDFMARNQDRVIYFDNITIGDGSATGISEVSTSNIHLGPNPSQNRLFNQSMYTLDHVEIYDILGRKVLSFAQVSKGESMNIQDLQQGTYVIKTKIQNQESFSRFLKK